MFYLFLIVGELQFQANVCWGRHKNFKDPMHRKWDMAKQNSKLKFFLHNLNLETPFDKWNCMKGLFAQGFSHAESIIMPSLYIRRVLFYKPIFHKYSQYFNIENKDVLNDQEIEKI